MSVDLDRVQRFVNPTTGEALTLASPDEDLARYLADVRDLEWQLRDTKRHVSKELLRRMDLAASNGAKGAWTVHAPGGLKITGASPAPVETWNELELREELLRLVDEGLLGAAAVDAAVEPVVTYKVHKSGIRTLRALGGRVAETVNRLCREEEKERRVTVTRV